MVEKVPKILQKKEIRSIIIITRLKSKKGVKL